MTGGGLTEIYAPYEDTKGSKTLRAQIDFVFVHGLNPKAARNHGRQTWTHSNKIFWPGDIIPKLLPKARVLLFEYNSQVIGSGAADLGIHDHADALLDCYRIFKPPYRLPILFVCHSLGGLVVKQALARAMLRTPSDPGMKEIKTLTYGIVFFGTPHRGGNGVSLGQVVEKVVKTFVGGGSNSLLQSLKKGSQLSIDAQDSFRAYIEDFKYLSVVEGRPKPGVGVIVSPESATLGADMRRETIISIDADHSKMCKFDSDSGMFMLIKHNLLQMASQAVQSNLEAAHSQKIGESSSRVLEIPIRGNPEERSQDAMPFKQSSRSLVEDETTLQCLASLEISNQKHLLRQRTARVVTGTCEWFTAHPTYTEWIENTNSRLLWLHGMPGCGKTILSSFLVTKLQNNENIVLYFFCDKSDPEFGRSLAAIVQSLVSQLCQMETKQQDQMLAILLRAFRMRKFHTDSKRSGFSWKWEDLWSTLTELLCSLELDTKIFIIVDALDECDEASKSGINCVSSILSSLMEEKSMPTLKVMLTCRQIDLAINDYYEKSSIWHKALEIKPDLTATDVKIVVQAKVAKLCQTKGISLEVARRLEKSLIQHASGMFLWVDLTVSQLKIDRIDHDIVGSMYLPLGLNEVYMSILQAANPSRVEHMRLILSFILTSTRPLNLSELQCLLETHCGGKWDGVKGDVSLLCGPLVAIQDDGGVLRMVHESARTFLTSFDLPSLGKPPKSKPFIDVSNAETIFASTCISYLEMHYDKVPSRRTNYRSKIEALLEKLPLMEYAYSSWNGHLRAANQDQVSWRQLIDNPELMETMYQLSYFLRHPMSRDVPWFPGHCNPLHFASFFNIPWLVKLLLDKKADPDGLKEEREIGTPLVWAAENGNCECMQDLLLHGAHPNLREYDGWTALHWTALNGHFAATELLLGNGANLLLKDNSGHDAEHYAAKAGNWRIVSLLRQKVRQLIHQGFTIEDSHSGSDSDIIESTATRFPRLGTGSGLPHNRLDDPATASANTKTFGSGGRVQAGMQMQDIVIAVMGGTGVGKSTFIATATRQELTIGHNLYSLTKRIESFEFSYNGLSITLVDTPGFDDTYRSEVDVLCDLAQWLEDTYVRGFRLTGIIFLHRISDIRFSGSMMRHLKMFRRLCGRDALSNVLLVTTMWNLVPLETGLQREGMLTSDPNFWGGMIKRGSRAFQFSGGRDSALKIIEALLNRDKITLQLQSELVDEHKALADTAAGAVVYQGLIEEEHKYRTDIENLKEDIKTATKENDLESQKELGGIIRDIEWKVEQARADQMRLSSVKAMNEEQVSNEAGQVSSVKQTIGRLV